MKSIKPLHGIDASVCISPFYVPCNQIEAYRAILLISGIQKFGWNSF